MKLLPEIKFILFTICVIIAFVWLTSYSTAASSASMDNETTSRPFTRMDQILLGLEREVNDPTNAIRPYKGDFTTRESRTIFTSDMKVEKNPARISIEYEVWMVKSMKDPWEKTCSTNLANTAIGLGFWHLGSLDPYFKETQDGKNKMFQRFFIKRYLGLNVAGISQNVSPYQPLVDAVDISITFKIMTDKAEVTNKRKCTLMIKDWSISHKEVEK